MRIKKIQAKNFRQALSLVKKELGPDGGHWVSAREQDAGRAVRWDDKAAK